MNFYKAGLAVLTAVLSFGALAEGGGDRTFALMMERNEKAMAAYAIKKGKPVPEVQAYRYAVPSRMTYEDSSGKLNTLEYQVMGVCRNNGG